MVFFNNAVCDILLGCIFYLSVSLIGNSIRMFLIKVDYARFIELHALLFEEGLLHILTAERERGGSLAQAVYHPVARDNARLRVCLLYTSRCV